MSQVTAATVKKLRDMTSAGMMDCKKALEATKNGSTQDEATWLQKASDWLRERGIAKAAGKAGRTTGEGVVEAYVHAPGGGVPKLGVLVEVNCESDFVAKTDDFKTLARELALQVAGAAPRWVRREDVPEDVLAREKSVYRAQVEGKPENVVEKILQGKLEAFYAEVCLLDQPWIRNEPGQKKKVEELVKESIAKLGENISVARFARFAVGEAETAGEAAEE